MTTFLLVRHGLTDAVGKVMAGWQPGWHLNERGKRQAETLAQQMRRFPIRGIYTSPLERAVETAEAIAAMHGLTPVKVEALGEIRIGEWEGLTLNELESREDWKCFNAYRGGTRAPGGELMLETQTRMVCELVRLRTAHRDETVTIVSHGDPLRAVVMHYLGMPLDLVHRLEIEPGSLSIIEDGDWGARVLRLNGTGDELP